jgi:beta-hydroxyacyl-ACP dehydratase FabZ
MDFDINSILRILPHRSPFVLIDRVVELAPRQSARALKCVTFNEPFFPGHFPGAPIFPGGLILEAFSQLTAVLAYASDPYDNAQKVMYFLGVEEAKFRRPVVPGDGDPAPLQHLEGRVRGERRRQRVREREAADGPDREDRPPAGLRRPRRLSRSGLNPPAGSGGAPRGASARRR